MKTNYSGRGMYAPAAWANAQKVAQRTKLWQIGEQLRLNPQAMPKFGDFPLDTADKHKAIGQTVSSYLKKGRGLVENACRGVFPKFKV